MTPLLSPEQSPDANNPSRPQTGVSAYLDRLGLDPATDDPPDLPTLRRLQHAHVTTVPFETLAITGDPYGTRTGEGVDLSLPHLYEKIVERRRGGYCFELNGLFYRLLDEVGYEADRVAARVVSDGALRTPANHHAIVVELDQRYLVDVGTGPPMIRRPLPLRGATRTDEAGIAWHVTESDRSDATYQTEYRRHDNAWTPRYVFDDVARPLHYFAAANDYLQSAPESPFTGEPYIGLSTEEGYRTLSADTLTEISQTDERKRTVTGDAWHATLKREFGLHYKQPRQRK